MSAKGAGSSALEGRGGYSVNVSDSPKFASGDYLSSSSHGYGHKSDQLYGDKVLDYSGIDRRQYGERQSAYMSRDLHSDPTSRYAADSVGFSHQHQVNAYPIKGILTALWFLEFLFAAHERWEFSICDFF